MGAALEAQIPFSAGHEIIRQKRRDLTLVAPISDVLFDQLVGAGVARRLIAAWIGNVSSGLRVQPSPGGGRIGTRCHRNSGPLELHVGSRATRGRSRRTVPPDLFDIGYGHREGERRSGDNGQPLRRRTAWWRSKRWRWTSRFYPCSVRTKTATLISGATSASFRMRHARQRGSWWSPRRSSLRTLSPVTRTELSSPVS